MGTKCNPSTGRQAAQQVGEVACQYVARRGARPQCGVEVADEEWDERSCPAWQGGGLPAGVAAGGGRRTGIPNPNSNCDQID